MFEIASAPSPRTPTSPSSSCETPSDFVHGERLGSRRSVGIPAADNRTRRGSGQLRRARLAARERRRRDRSSVALPSSPEYAAFRRRNRLLGEGLPGARRRAGAAARGAPREAFAEPAKRGCPPVAGCRELTAHRVTAYFIQPVGAGGEPGRGATACRARKSGQARGTGFCGPLPPAPRASFAIARSARVVRFAARTAARAPINPASPFTEPVAAHCLP